MKKQLFFLCLLAVQTATAALPPLWQSVNEIKTILDDPRFGTELESGELILKIKKTDEGWLIVTNRHRLYVKVIEQPQTRPGPAKFTLEFQKDE